MQDDYTIQPGDMIAHCQVLRQIGISGKGAVYLVRHELLGDLRAMKILPADQGRQDAVIRIIKEARTASLLDHPNLVKILDAGLDKEKKLYYILFEYVDGCTLADILAKTRQINEFHALIIAEAVTSALIAFSEQGFVHRNINPESIILSRLGKVKLANLGRVKNPSFDSVFMTEPMACGSGYTAPEQISDFHSVDGRADIYSLGAVLFKMLIGTTDPTADPLSILKRIRNHSLSDSEKHWNISPSIVRLLMRMMALRRSDRPANAQQLLKELQALKIIPPGTDREQLICEMISQAESGTYRLISLSPAEFHAAQVSGLKTEVTRFWPVLLCVLVPLTWLAVKMFLPLLEEEDHEIPTIRQPAVQLEKEASGQEPGVPEEAVPQTQDTSGKEEKAPASGETPAGPEKTEGQAESAPEELYRQAENALQAGHYDQAVSLLVKAAPGYPPAQMELGIMYLNGQGLPQDRNQGIRLLTQAAQRGLAKAQYLLAMVYKIGPDADPKQSLAWCRKAAASEHTAALKELALMLRDGFGCEKDPRSALFFLEKSAGKGDPESMYLAGEMYLNGQGTVPNLDKAQQYFLQAAAAGFSKANAKIHQIDLLKNRESFFRRHRQEPPETLFRLAENCFRNERDAEALELLKMAVEKQYGPAELKLAMLHLKADKVENPDSEYGFKLLLNAARRDIAEAQYQLALVYQEGIVVKADPEQAFSWCRQAADKSFPPALERLGDFYRRGVGCTRNPAMARVYYEQGMRKGQIGSIFKLAQLLESGESGPRVPEKAVKYYRMAADAGHSEAKAALARLLPDKPPQPAPETSQGSDPVPASSKDPDSGNAESMYLAAQKIYDSHTTNKVQARQAYTWCWRASAKGHVKARGLLGIMNLKGFGCPIDLTEAFRLLRDAAELGDVESLYHLGESYRLGIGVEQNAQKAESFYRQAAGKGHPKAKQMLAGPRPKLKRFTPDEFAYQLSLANRGNLEAQYLVGMAFLKGNGTRPDPRKAYFWLMKAALRKHPDAQCQTGVLLQEGIGCTRSYQSAFRWFSKAAAQEHPEAIFRLGEMYLLGKGIDRPDLQRAAELFRRSALLGNEDAARSLDSLKRATLTHGR